MVEEPTIDRKADSIWEFLKKNSFWFWLIWFFVIFSYSGFRIGTIVESFRYFSWLIINIGITYFAYRTNKEWKRFIVGFYLILAILGFSGGLFLLIFPLSIAILMTVGVLFLLIILKFRGLV